MRVSPFFLDLCCRSGDATWEKASLESMPLRPKSIHATSPPLLMEPPPVRQCRSYLGDIVIDLHCCRRFDDIAIDSMKSCCAIWRTIIFEILRLLALLHPSRAFANRTRGGRRSPMLTVL